MTSGTTMATSQRTTPHADVDDINVDVEQSASAGKPAKKRTNPLATISNLRHILSVHKAAGAVGGAVGGAVDTAGAASRETALLAGRTLLMLLNNPITGPATMRMLREGPDTATALLDLLLVPVLPTVRMLVGKQLIEMSQPGAAVPVNSVITFAFARRLNVEPGDLRAGKVVPELSLRLSPLAAGLGGMVKMVGQSGAAVGSTAASAVPGKKTKKAKADDAQGSVAALKELRDAGIISGREYERKKAKALGTNAEKAEEWPVEYRDIKEQIIKMTPTLKFSLSLGQLDAYVGATGWLGSLLSGSTQPSEAALARLRLERVSVEARVRIFWHPRAQKAKVVMLSEPPPKVVELSHELTVLRSCAVPPELNQRLLELVLPKLAGKFFDIDLKPPRGDDAAPDSGDEAAGKAGKKKTKKSSSGKRSPRREGESEAKADDEAADDE
ncbi:hypothetical protein EMIHUDRAFT_226931 [Emiliania huxleyi CCMP1516]|uniref:SHOCT domain-containing protein n=4 Tax=Emiliania huxleyi TaxID=2903 RepID=A0A0D3KJY4_EMIH1|nr:hypothetical protein EMIHUDRAFT_226931 [Emiliania huxleyi CCMP1516]EOD36069.1 hypothetical protein EMIHUDRAFT_226931 [Emiliania huxleyi CCMP1516]|eukprot:XP_005788498.1 hypothetical protein EMIHUDRAFT_226931 [Emiliania huxleyi CCMP1516]